MHDLCLRLIISQSFMHLLAILICHLDISEPALHLGQVWQITSSSIVHFSPHFLPSIKLFLLFCGLLVNHHFGFFNFIEESSIHLSRQIDIKNRLLWVILFIIEKRRNSGCISRCRSWKLRPSFVRWNLLIIGEWFLSFLIHLLLLFQLL